MEVDAQLHAVAGLSDQKQKLEQYKQLLHSILASSSVEACINFVDHMLSDDVPLVVSRQILQVFAQEIPKVPADVHKPIATHTLEKIQPRVVSFEEQVTFIRESLAGLLEQEEEWTKAAQILAGIDLDSGMRVLDNQYKLQKNIKIAMLYLEDDDPVSAEQYIKKASSLITASKDSLLELHYKTCYARIMDSKRRFLDAAQRYYELSSMQQRDIAGKMIDDDELETALKAAITCTVLAAAGPQRSRMLSTLYKDERSARLPVYPFLTKVHLERILRREEVEAFAQTLKPHQRALLSDGSTVLDKAVMQHNLLSASKLYNNISIPELGTMLCVAAEKAEQIAADMIIEGRLQGSIDQVERLIDFDNKVEPLMQWDRQIQSVCQQVNDIIDVMAKTVNNMVEA
eukprot:jgi/Chrzof1/8740/Cz03g22180.t1